ncbi:MAG: O-antigen ligase family protein [Planctomycetes bacterium]|nr:O-antigen ligase family protein [Planctomycetota bacterium]
MTATGTTALLRWATYAAVFASGIVFIEPAPTDLLFFVVFGLVALHRESIDLTGFGTMLIASIAIFLLANGLSLMAAETYLKATAYLVVTIYMFVMFAFVAGWIGRHADEGYSLLTRAFCSGALVVGMIGILARFRLMPRSEIFFLGEHALRIKSTFKDPNVFAPYMVAAFMLVLNDAITGRRKILNASVYGIVFLLSILFAFSRGAFFHLAVSLLVYMTALLVFVRDPKITKRLVLGSLIAGTAVTAFGVYALAVTGLDGFLAERLSVQSYDTERFAMQALTLEVSLEHPFGIGPGEWNVSRFPNDPHNVYLRVLAENGLLGAIGWILWCGCCAVTAMSGILRRSEAAPMYAAALAILLGLYAEAMIIDTLHWRHLFFVAGIPLGLGIAERRKTVPA